MRSRPSAREPVPSDLPEAPATAAGEQADLALAVFLEPHVDARRVLLLGDARGVLADRFDRLASQLEIIDPSAREPSDGEVPELPFDDESFDLVLVCDVSALPEPTAGALRELRRVLARSGVLAVVGTLPTRRRRRGPAPVQAFEALLAGEFRHVRVLTQAPIAGYALGALDERAGEEISVDSSLVREQGRQPERLIGLASESRLPAEPRVWVEVPGGASQPEPATSMALVAELRRAEDEAREALHRESDLLRELEGERRARAEAETHAERARLYERKLLAAEADYDDAVARVRYFESTIGEQEAAARHEREHREQAERELSSVTKELAQLRQAAQRTESTSAGARAELEAAHAENEQLEARLVELGKQLLELEQDRRQREQAARDLLEELRRVEGDRTAAVEHDARVAELEAERDRAVQRALDAEVAREAAQMRSDELRAELEELSARPASSGARQEQQPAALDSTSELARLRGELRGATLRLTEGELALAAVRSPGEQLAQSQRELKLLRQRLGETEAQLHAMRESPARAGGAVMDAARASELEQALAGADQRLLELTRELEEADRFAELHAEDAERLTSIEAALETSRDQVEDLEQDVRALEQELHTARVTLNAQQDDLTRAKEKQERHESERDDALSALADARAILSQLASSVGADANEPASIVEAVRNQRDSAVDALRTDLARRDQRIEQLEQWLIEARGTSVDTGNQAEGGSSADDTDA